MGNNLWNKFKWHLQKFMIGRNGRDELQLAMLYVAFVLYVFAGFLDKLFPFPLFRILGWLGIVYSIYRFCSKDVNRRREENRKFLQEIEFLKLRISVRKTHKIYRCKGCGRKIRVPRGKGKIEIRCPLCGKTFIRRT